MRAALTYSDMEKIAGLTFGPSWIWKCEHSPIGWCLYDTEAQEFGFYDHCKFCELPMERK